jgi:hypothetical protein
VRVLDHLLFMNSKTLFKVRAFVARPVCGAGTQLFVMRQTACHSFNAKTRSARTGCL